MAGLKLLVLACLLTLALANPLFLLGGGKGKGLLGGGGGGDGYDGGSGGGGLLGPVLGGGGKGGLLGGVLGKKGVLGKSLGGLLSGALGPLGNGLTKITGNAKSILKDLEKGKIPGLVDDVMNTLINLGYAVGGIVNAILPGTGTAISNLLVGLFKLLLCTLGSPGLTGSLLHDRRPGYDNTFVCSPSFGTKYGCKSYDGGNNPQDVIDFYNLANIEADLLVAINKLTNGLGLDGLTGNVRVILDLVLQLVGITKKSSYCKEDFVTVVVNLSAILGAVGNSVKVGLGDKLVSDLLSNIAVTLNAKILGGIDLRVYIGPTKKIISGCKRDTLLGAVVGVVNRKGGKKGLGGVVGGVLKTVGGVVKGVLGKGLLSGVFGALNKGLTKITGNVKHILADLGHAKIPGTVDDVFVLVINLVRTVGGILNAILPGTGTAVARLLVGLLRVLLCSLGSPGLTGSLFNDRRPGFGNTYVCAPKYGTGCGLRPYDGGNSRDDIINFYNLGNIEAELNAAIYKLTKGVGLKGVKGNLKHILQWVLELVGLLKKSKHTNKDFALVIVNLSTILGGVANSVQVGLGDKLLNDLLGHLSLILNAKVIGIDLRVYLTTAKRNVSRCKRDRLYGTVNYAESRSSSSTTDESSSSDTTTSTDTVTTTDDSSTVTSTDNSSTVTGSDDSNTSSTSDSSTSTGDSTTSTNDSSSSTDTSTDTSTNTSNTDTTTTDTTTTTTDTSTNESNNSDTSNSSTNDSSSSDSSSTGVSSNNNSNNNNRVVRRKGSLGSFLSSTLGIVGKGLKKITKNLNNVLKNLLKLKVPATVDDVLGLLITVGQFVGEVLDRLLPGVGTSVSNLLVGVFKILICVLGSPGLTGSLLNDRRPGSNIPSDIPAVCSPNFGTSCGLPPYNGGYTNAQDLIDFYALANIEADLLAAINKLTNGAGLSGLTGNVRVILEWVLELVGVCKKSTYTNQELVTIIVNLTSILGGIGNSVQIGLGDLLVEEILKNVYVVLNVQVLGVDLRVYIKTIKKSISRCRRDTLNGILVDVTVNVANSQTSSNYDSSDYSSQANQSQTSESQASQSQASDSQASQSQSSESQSNQSQSNQSQSSESQTSQSQSNQSQSSDSQTSSSQSQSNQSQTQSTETQSQTTVTQVQTVQTTETQTSETQATETQATQTSTS